jgi:hypothetical protein
MSNSKISTLLVTASEKLIQQAVPVISEIVVKTGIKNIGLANMELPNTCLFNDELQKILELRNAILNKINTTSKTIENLSKTLNPLNKAATTAQTSLNTAKTAVDIAAIALKAVPSPPGIPGIILTSYVDVATLVNITLPPTVILATNKVMSITSALNYANSILSKLVGILKSIDQYLAGCNVSLDGSPTISSYADKINQQYSAVQDNGIQGLNTQGNQGNQGNLEVYNGFTLGIVEEPYTPTVNRRKAVAKNSQGIILLSTPLTFSTDNQTLLTAIKLIIDSNNLKAD